jgi:hypothetical protein
MVSPLVPGVSAEEGNTTEIDFLRGEHSPAGSGNFVTGNLGLYAEGSTIRFRIDLTTTNAPMGGESGTIQVLYTSNPAAASSRMGR